MVSSMRKKTARNARRKKTSSTAMEIMEVGAEEEVIPSAAKMPKTSAKTAPKKPKTPKKKEEKMPAEEPLPDLKASPKPAVTYSFGFGDGEKTIIAENDNGILEITDVGEPIYSLADWNLVISKTDIIPLEGRTGDTIDFPKGMTRGSLLNADGYRADFCNAEKITIPETDTPEATKGKNHLFLMGDLGENGTADWGLVVSGLKIVNLAKTNDFEVSLNPEEIGILTGPQGNILHFANIASVRIPNLKNITKEFKSYNIQEVLAEEISLTPEKEELFYFSANDESNEFVGTPTRSIIRIETDSTYGWNVSFSGGVMMSLSDVKEFQGRHGRLPYDAGTIIHGDKTLQFSGVTAILIYEPPTYSAYDLA